MGNCGTYHRPQLPHGEGTGEAPKSWHHLSEVSNLHGLVNACGLIRFRPFWTVTALLICLRFIRSTGENLLCWVITWLLLRVTYRRTMSRVVCPRICWRLNTSPPLTR